MKFYVIRRPRTTEGGPVYGEMFWEDRYAPAELVLEGFHLDSVICPVYPEHQRPDPASRSDLAIRLNPKRVGDFVWTWHGEPLITDRVLQLFQQARFSGFGVRAVEIVGSVTNQPVPRDLTLWELVTGGRAGYAGPRSSLRRVLHCGFCGLDRYSSYQNGIFVDEAQWDGSDFSSIVEHPQLILVTERVKELIVTERLTNVFLVPSEELRWPRAVVTPEEVYET